MKIDKKTLSYLADLAKLKLSDKETAKFSEQLSEIVSFVEKLKEVKSEVKIKKEYLSLDEISRDDDCVLWPSDEKDLALNKRKNSSGLIKAPKIR